MSFKNEGISGTLQGFRRISNRFRSATWSFRRVSGTLEGFRNVTRRFGSSERSEESQGA